MPQINKNNLYNYIQSLLKEQYYVGLHGIADVSDILNQYSNLSKTEKANNILKNGLKNARGTTIGLTVRNFGDLANENDEKINRFINYGFYSPSGKETVVVIAIPYFFEDSKGRKLFGGYKEYKSQGSTTSKEEKAECITDYLFRNNIPTEMILGYYSYDKNSNLVDFVQNPKHYSKLSKLERDEFISKNIPPQFAYDVNNSETMEKVEKMGFLIDAISRTTSQYKTLNDNRNNNKNDITESLIEDEMSQPLFDTTQSFDPQMDLVKKLDVFLSKINSNFGIKSDLLNEALKRASQNPTFLEWLEYQKEDLLLKSSEFKGNDSLLAYKNTTFDVQVENNNLNYGSNNLLNGFMALPIYSYPVSNYSTDEDFMMKYICKMVVGDNQYVVFERNIKKSDLDAMLKNILAEIDKAEKTKGMSLTFDEKKEIFDRIAISYGINNSISFDAGVYISNWESFKEQYKEQNGIEIRDIDNLGQSNWKIVGYEMVDNRKSINGNVLSLESQLLQSRGISQQSNISKQNLHIDSNEQNIQKDDMNSLDQQKYEEWVLNTWFKKFVVLLAQNKILMLKEFLLSDELDSLENNNQAKEIINHFFYDVMIPSSMDEKNLLMDLIENKNKEIANRINELESEKKLELEKWSKENNGRVSNFDFINSPKLSPKESFTRELKSKLRKTLEESVKNFELRAQLVQHTTVENEADTEKILSDMCSIPDMSYENLRKEQMKLEKLNDEFNRELNGYSVEQLASLKPYEIDREKLKYNFETIIESQVGIKDVLINSGIYDLSGEFDTLPPLSEVYDFDISKYNQFNVNETKQMIVDFEKHLASKGMSSTQIDEVYRNYFEKNKKGCIDMFFGELPRKQNISYYKEHPDIVEEKQKYSIEELDSLSLSEIDKSLVVPNFDIVCNSKTSINIGIKSSIARAIGKQLGFTVSNLESTEIIDMYQEIIDKLHSEMKKAGYNDEQIQDFYKKYYADHKETLDTEFLAELSSRQSLLKPYTTNR